MKTKDHNQELAARKTHEADVNKCHNNSRESLSTNGHGQERDMAEDRSVMEDNETNIFDHKSSHKGTVEQLNPDVELAALGQDRNSDHKGSLEVDGCPKIHDTKKLIQNVTGSSLEIKANTTKADFCLAGMELDDDKKSLPEDDVDIFPQILGAKGTDISNPQGNADKLYSKIEPSIDSSTEEEPDHYPKIHDPKASDQNGYDEVDQYPRIHNPQIVSPFETPRGSLRKSRYDDVKGNIFTSSSVSDLRRSKKSKFSHQSTRSCSSLFLSHSASQKSVIVSEISKNEEDIGPDDVFPPEDNISESSTNSSAVIHFPVDIEHSICNVNQYPKCPDISPDKMNYLNETSSLPDVRDEVDIVDTDKFIPNDEDQKKATNCCSKLCTSNGFRVSLFSLLLYLAGPALYLLDIGSDIYLAQEYYSEGNIWWFILTVAFIVVPAITMNVFSLVYYLFTSSRRKEISGIWVTRGLFHFVLLGPLLRMFQTIRYACFTRKCCLNKEKWHQLSEEEQEKQLCQFKSKMAAHAANSDFIRLFEIYMEAMPQLVLQLYVMTLLGSGTNLSLFLKQCFSLITSFIAVSVAQPGFQKSTRFAEHPNDVTKNISMPGMVLNALSTAIVIAARVLSMAMFASIHKRLLLILAGVHWFVMFVWSILQKTTFCKTFDDKESPKPCLFGMLELCYNAATAFIMLFSYINLTPGDTLINRLAFYTLTYFENIVLVAMWYRGSYVILWYYVPILTYVIVSFLPFTGLLILYYTKFHPKKVNCVI